MEALVSFYSVGWILLLLLSLIVFVVGVTRWVIETDDSGKGFALVLGSFLPLGLAIGGATRPPQTNVIQLSPGEEVVGSYQKPNSWARVVVRLENGEYSVRDVILPTGKELEIRGSIRIEK
jgi:hypothetical protein